MAHDRRLTTLLAKQTGGDAGGPKLPQDAIEVRIETRVGPGMAEDITLINRSMIGLTPEIRLDVDGDFADVQVRSGVDGPFLGHEARRARKVHRWLGHR